MTCDSTSTLNIGDTIRLEVTFTEQTSGDLVDPTAVAIKIKPPSGIVLPDTAIRDSLGKYYFDFVPTQAGYHYYRFEGTGAVIAANEDSFKVAVSNVLG